MNNNTELSNAALKISIYVKVGGIVTMLLAFLINFTLFTVATKCLKRILHNMLIICMCLNNSLVSLTSMVALLLLLKEDMSSNKIFCITTAIITCYSLCLSYALVFLICIERYLTIKTFNFGTRITLLLERQKHRILLVTHVLFLVASLVVNISLPTASSLASIPACSPTVLFEDLYPVYMGVVWAPMTILLLVVIVLYIYNCYVLWETFFRKSKENQIFPLANLKIPKRMPPNNEIGHDMSIEVLDLEVIEAFSQASIPKTSTSHSLDRCDVDVMSSESSPKPCTSYSFERCDADVLTPELNPEPFASGSFQLCNDDQKGQAIVKNKREDIDHSLMTGTSTNTTRKNVKQNTWERRAFVMNLVVTGTTICLTLPFVASLWIELVDSTIVSMTTLSTLSLLSSMNCFSDPLIYIFSVPEIRKRFTEFYRNLRQNA